MNKIYKIYIYPVYPVNPVKKMEIPILFKINMQEPEDNLTNGNQVSGTGP